MTTRRKFGMLAAAGWLLGACSSQDSHTKIVVAVWSNLAVPTEMDSIRVDVSGSTASPPVEFPLTTGNESGKTRLPVVLEVVSPDNQGREFEVTATAFLGSDSVVSQTARLAFDPGRSRVLTLFLDSACAGAISGHCVQPLDVDVHGLPEYVPNAPFTRPDASAGIASDGGASSADSGGTDLSADSGGIDLSTDTRQIGDAGADHPVAVPDAGTERSADSPQGTDASPDAPLDLAAPEAAPDLALPDATPDCASGCAQVRDSAADTYETTRDAEGDPPVEARVEGRDASPDAPPDLTVPIEAGRDLAVPDGPSACVLPTTTCAGECINPQTSIDNCGACGQACGAQNGTPSCTTGVCSMSDCSPGFLDCSTDENTSRDGCETDGNSDSANCGRCGNECPSKVCRNRACLATARYGNTGPGVSSSPFERDFLAGIQIYIPNQSVVTGLGAVLYDATASCTMVLGLYGDVAGNPGALVATIASPALVAPGGAELSVDPPVDVAAGTYWILGVWDSLATFSSNSTTTVTWRYASRPFGALPSTAPSSMSAISLPPPNLYAIVAQ